MLLIRKSHSFRSGFGEWKLPLRRGKNVHLQANRAPDLGMLLGERSTGWVLASRALVRNAQIALLNVLSLCSLLPSFKCEVPGVYHPQYFHVYEFLIHGHLGVENWEGKQQVHGKRGSCGNPSLWLTLWTDL